MDLGDGSGAYLTFGQARSLSQLDRGRNTGLGTSRISNGTDPYNCSGRKLYYFHMTIRKHSLRKYNHVTQTSSPVNSKSQSWILNPGPLLALTCLYDILYKEREQESKHFAPGWEPDHFGEDAELFRKNWVASLER